MIVQNFICEDCKNMPICKEFATLKKFSEEYARNPLHTDIKIINCDNFTKDGEEEE